MVFSGEMIPTKRLGNNVATKASFKKLYCRDPGSGNECGRGEEERRKPIMLLASILLKIKFLQ